MLYSSLSWIVLQRFDLMNARMLFQFSLLLFGVSSCAANIGLGVRVGQSFMMGKTNWGKWSERVLCKTGVSGFRLRVESTRKTDDTSLDGIQLRCLDSSVTKEVTGNVGDWKSWRLCSGGKRVTSFSLRSEAPQGRLRDDTGANNVRMMCSDGRVLHGGGNNWGSWESDKSCPDKSHFCGVKAKIERGKKLLRDDTGMNKIIFYCCADINECASNNGGCHADALCTNIAGSYMCQCKKGYSGNGKICADINECASNNGGCDRNAVCTNVEGSYKCRCKDRYSGNGKTCGAGIHVTLKIIYVKSGTIPYPGCGRSLFSREARTCFQLCRGCGEKKSDDGNMVNDSPVMDNIHFPSTNCYASPTSDPADPRRFYLIKDGSPADKTFVAGKITKDMISFSVRPLGEVPREDQEPLRFAMCDIKVKRIGEKRDATIRATARLDDFHRKPNY